MPLCFHPDGVRVSARPFLNGRAEPGCRRLADDREGGVGRHPEVGPEVAVLLRREDPELVAVLLPLAVAADERPDAAASTATSSTSGPPIERDAYPTLLQQQGLPRVYAVWGSPETPALAG